MRLAKCKSSCDGGDGIPIHDPLYSTIQRFKAPLSSIDHIEIIRGGGSSLWGNLAVGRGSEHC
jgi:outer membrane cobalamin receptor